MTWFFAAAIIVVLALAAMVGQRRWGSMPDLVDGRPFRALPEGRLGADELREVRFTVVPRGYAPEQVDALLNRLAEQLRDGQDHPAPLVDSSRSLATQEVREVSSTSRQDTPDSPRGDGSHPAGGPVPGA